MIKMVMPEKYDIIIQAGQSNAEGSGVGPVLSEAEYIPQSNILYLTSEYKVKVENGEVQVEFLDKEFDIEIAKEREEKDGNISGDFSFSFAKDYAKKFLKDSGRKILIIRCGVGGTSFAQKHWGLQDICYLKMIEMVDYALRLNSENRIVAFLWHQGESDVINKSEPKEFYENLTNLLKSVRNRYGEMPFIAGDFVYDWRNRNLTECSPILKEIRRVVQENKLCAFVETDGLLSNAQKNNNSDGIHFCRESLYELGHRYFKAYAKL